MKKIIVITGQTATGKTKYALEIAQKYNGEIINCDSRQIYKKLDIITGKDISEKNFRIRTKISGLDIGYYSIRHPALKTKTSVRLWLYDIIDPKKYFSSYDYSNCALKTIRDIEARGKTAIIVGGSYFYIRHLLYGTGTENIKPNWKLRRRLETESVTKLQTILRDISPSAFSEMNNSDRSNPRRLIRRIETANTKPKSLVNPERRLNRKSSDIRIIAFRFSSNENLKKTISMRVEERIKKGAVEEVRTLLSQGYGPHDPGLKTIGYQQIISYLQNKTSLKEAISDWCIKEMQYAKRQYTFLKKYLPSENWRYYEINYGTKTAV